jgi:hypothetical protein
VKVTVAWVRRRHALLEETIDRLVVALSERRTSSARKMQLAMKVEEAQSLLDEGRLMLSEMERKEDQKP